MKDEANIIAAEISQLLTEWHLCDPVQFEGLKGRMDCCISLMKKFEITEDELSAGFNNINLAGLLASKLTRSN